MRRLWAVATGEYSDYQVALLAESKEQAEAVAEYLNRSTPEWHEYRVDETRPLVEYGDPLPQQVIRWRAYTEDGGGTRAWPTTGWDFEQGDPMVESAGNAQFRRWHAYYYPTEQAAIEAVQALKAAEEAKEHQ